MALKKGHPVFQGVIDSYPRGKKVYPTIPGGQPGRVPIPYLETDADRKPVEKYLAKIGACVDKHGLNLTLDLGKKFCSVEA